MDNQTGSYMINNFIDQMTKYLGKRTLRKMCDEIQYDLHERGKQHTMNVFNDNTAYLMFKKNEESDNKKDMNEQIELQHYIGVNNGGNSDKNKKEGLELMTNTTNIVQDNNNHDDKNEVEEKDEYQTIIQDELEFTDNTGNKVETAVDDDDNDEDDQTESELSDDEIDDLMLMVDEIQQNLEI